MFSSSFKVVEYIWPTNDELWLEIALKTEEPLEVFLCREKNLKQTLIDMPALKKLIKVMPLKSIQGSPLTVLGENEESIASIFPDSIGRFFKANEEAIKVIHVTDQRCYTNYPVVIKVCLLLGDNNEALDRAAKVFNFILD